MNLKLVAGIVMLVLWTGITAITEAPGYVHLLLVFGVFLLVWGVTLRGASVAPAAGKNQDRVR